MFGSLLKSISKSIWGEKIRAQVISGPIKKVLFYLDAVWMEKKSKARGASKRWVLFNHPKIYEIFHAPSVTFNR